MPTPIISVARRSATPLALLALILVTWACKEKTPPPTKSETTTAAPAAPVTAPAAPTAVNAPDSFRVAFATSRGPFVVAVTRAWSPKGADRFYELVKTGYFTDVRFFRVIPGFVAQFGMHGDPKTNDKWKERTIPDDPVVQSNKKGTIVFATRGPDTRSNQFFINLADNASLDRQGFSAFGRVVSGMSVVENIYSGYGETPEQERIASAGNAYLTKQFPKLDYIKAAKVVGEKTKAP